MYCSTVYLGNPHYPNLKGVRGSRLFSQKQKDCICCIPVLFCWFLHFCFFEHESAVITTYFPLIPCIIILVVFFSQRRLKLVIDKENEVGGQAENKLYSKLYKLYHIVISTISGKQKQALKNVKKIISKIFIMTNIGKVMAPL